MSRSHTFCPEIQFRMQHSPSAVLDLRIADHSKENWELYALLHQSRVIHQLLLELQPELQAYNLVATNPVLHRLLERLNALPEMARDFRHRFSGTTQASLQDGAYYRSVLSQMISNQAPTPWI